MMEFEEITLENMEEYIRKYAFKYDLCEGQRSRVRVYVKSLVEKTGNFNTWELEEVCKTKAFASKKLKVVK